MTMKNLFAILLASISKFIENNGPMNAAAMAYYTAFALPSLLVISIMIVGIFIEPQEIRGEIGRQIESVAGHDTAEQIQEIVVAANKPKETYIASTIGFVMLLIGASGVLAQLQTTLNNFWGVKDVSAENGWMSLIFKRLVSFGMVFVIAFLLLVTITVRAAIAEFGQQLDSLLPAPWNSGMVSLINIGATFVILILVLAGMFRFLPDAEVPWRCVWFGATVTSVLFALGQQAMAVYLKYAHPGEVYGTAGALAVILIWVYYACMILLFGAQLTRVWEDSRGQVQMRES